MKNRGQILILTFIFMGVILIITASLVAFVHQNVTATRRALAKEQARLLAEAGIDKAVWQLNQTAGAYTGESNTALGTGIFDVSVANLSGTSRELTVTGYAPNKTAALGKSQIKVQVSIDTTIVSFNYGVQVGEGGLFMNNNARVNGNVYSNGVIDGASGTRITGDAFSAGALGEITDMQIDGTAYAHRVRYSTIGGNAKGDFLSNSTIGGSVFFREISNCTVGGNASYTSKLNCTIAGNQYTPYPGEPDPAALPFPISDSQIQNWKNQAAAGGTIVGNYTLSNWQAASLGPKKITGNLRVSNFALLTLTGPLWVVGTINISNNAGLRLHPSYGNNSEAVIADGIVDVANNAVFLKAGSQSYILMLTTSASDDAFDIGNNALALISYAANGTVDVSNNVWIREVTGRKIRISNNAIVTYESGLANMQFTSGPGASWTILRGTWRETE